MPTYEIFINVLLTFSQNIGTTRSEVDSVDSIVQVPGDGEDKNIATNSE